MASNSPSSPLEWLGAMLKEAHAAQRSAENELDEVKRQLRTAQETIAAQKQELMKSRQNLELARTETKNQFQQLAFQKAAQQIQTQGFPQGQNPQTYRNQLAQHYFRQLIRYRQQHQQQREEEGQ
ncbi:uncharacterized protein J4E78_001616 [Alternaria triticimaculans]|uniref:uncharacterized protein n=1 Tax=Alternaria triticimaculans TaxID=297637 RepID=UPI0020C337D0|nr:uncharacterized protein J4E78_001616 [Alternaria triticimaculans]KAI4673109.1 hypothetical protein J4E78_001616 [Alternaria triticimaculans]